MPPPATTSSKALRRIAPRWWQRLFAPAFSQITVTEEAKQRLQDAEKRGLVVHALRVRRKVDPLFLTDLLLRLGLREPSWRHDHFSSKRDPSSAGLVQALQRDASALLFLRRPRTLRNSTTAYSQEHVEALLALQRTINKPILRSRDEDREFRC